MQIWKILKTCKGILIPNAGWSGCDGGFQCCLLMWMSGSLFERTERSLVFGHDDDSVVTVVLTWIGDYQVMWWYFHTGSVSVWSNLKIPLPLIGWYSKVA